MDALFNSSVQGLPHLWASTCACCSSCDIGMPCATRHIIELPQNYYDLAAAHLLLPGELGHPLLSNRLQIHRSASRSWLQCSFKRAQPLNN